MREARSKQSALYAITAAEESCGLISSCLPSLLLKVMLNHLTRRYSLSLTHIDGNLVVEGVDAVMYWRPPQGNCSKCFIKNFSSMKMIKKIYDVFLISVFLIYYVVRKNQEILN